MLVVIVIIGMLAGMIVGIASVVNASKERAQCRAEMQQILFLLEDYKLKIGKYPDAGADIMAVKTKLENILGAVQVASKTDFKDPWEQYYQYVRRNDESCTLFSMGPDMDSGTTETDVDNISPTE